MKYKYIATLALTSLVLVSCGKTPQENSNTGIANPASVYCIEKGGEVDIKTDESGNQYGICNLPDGTQIDEWEFYRANNPQE